MATKDFDKAQAAIEVPSAHDFANVDDETADGEEIVTNPKDLYRKFEELANKGYINPNTGAQASGAS